MKSKEDRIHHKERLKANRRFHWGQDLLFDKNDKAPMVVDTPTPCSCWMCGNPRKYFKQKTLQEKTFDDILRSYSE
jgi:hypothetical protein